MPIFTARACQNCSKSYIPSGPAQKMCAECGPSVRKARHEKYLQEAYRPPSGVGSGGNQQGANNHMWKGGTSPYFYQNKKLDGMSIYACERCGADLSKYVRNAARRGYWGVHHKDHDTSNNDVGNLELLCKRCHQVEHRCWENFNN